VLSRPLTGVDEVVPPAIDTPASWKAPRPGSSGDPERMESPDGVNALANEVQQIVQEALQTVSRATMGSSWQDPRVDQVAQALRESLFKPGVVEARLAVRRQLVKAYGAEREGGVAEEVPRRSRDAAAIARIAKEAKPIEKKIRRFRWFGEREDLWLDRFRCRGALDPRRLYRLGISELVYRKWNEGTVTDYRGHPTVVLAKDGSSSNTRATTLAGQILVTAFLRIQRIARITVVAADYSSGPAGPLVRWLYHPTKTAVGPKEAAEAVAGLPAEGVGSNEDVLSISHILRETFDALGPKQNMIFINLTDGKWNSPIDELRAMVRHVRDEFDLSYTVLVLGDHPVTLPEADHIVSVPEAELGQPVLIAERIAGHINKLVVSRRGRRRQNRV
jgi:hypothetical protein